jgi:hypothetical protein
MTLFIIFPEKKNSIIALYIMSLHFNPCYAIGPWGYPIKITNFRKCSTVDGYIVDFLHNDYLWTNEKQSKFYDYRSYEDAWNAFCKDYPLLYFVDQNK